MNKTTPAANLMQVNASCQCIRDALEQLNNLRIIQPFDVTGETTSRFGYVECCMASKDEAIRLSAFLCRSELLGRSFAVLPVDNKVIIFVVER